MATLVATDINDLVAGTLRELGRLKFNQIAQNLVDYEVFSHWFRQDKVQFDSGIGIQRNLMNSLGNQAQHVGMYQTDTVNVPDLMDQMQVNWVHAQTAWAFERREMLMNKGKELIFNIIQPRRVAAMISLVEELETRAWSVPGVNDKVRPWGLPYWVVKNNTTGFNGGAPSGHTTVGGVSLTETPTFKNYTAQYTNVTKQDLVKKLRTAHRKIQFKSPVDVNEYRSSKGFRYRLYVNESTLSSLEDLGEAQNENLGRDVASMDNSIVFRGHPIRWVPKLDEDTTNPVYMIDHETFMPVCLKGDYLRESDVMMAANAHNVYNVFVDLTYNYLCHDRRRNAVIATNTS